MDIYLITSWQGVRDMHIVTQTLFISGTWFKYDSDACIINVWGCVQIFPR